MEKGIDVSSYQGTIDWKKAKADGVGFAILKVIRKDLSPDKQFEKNWTGCESAGVTIQGVYNYSYATTVEKAKKDAEKVVNILGDRQTMVWLDVEDGCQKNLGSKLIDIIKAYRAIIVSAGMDFGVYTGLSFYKTYIMPYEANIVDMPFWIARYPSSNSMSIRAATMSTYKPCILPVLCGWQYSSKGSVNGISGCVDLNEWYADIESELVYNETPKMYNLVDFVNDSKKVWGVDDTDSMIKRTVTVSTVSNNHHAIVTPLERYMKSMGYYTGKIEADEGKTPTFGNGMKKAIKLYQEHVVKAKEKYRDGILTAKSATWKCLYK